MEEQIAITGMSYVFDREQLTERNKAFARDAIEQKRSIDDLVNDMEEGIASGKYSKALLYNTFQMETQRAIQRKVSPVPALAYGAGIGTLCGIAYDALYHGFSLESLGVDLSVSIIFGLTLGLIPPLFLSFCYSGHVFNPKHPKNEVINKLRDTLLKEHKLTYEATKNPIERTESGYKYRRALWTTARGYYPDYALRFVTCEFEEHALVDDRGNTIFSLVLNNSIPIAIIYGDHKHILIEDKVGMKISLSPFSIPCPQRTIELFEAAVHPYLKVQKGERIFVAEC